MYEAEISVPENLCYSLPELSANGTHRGGTLFTPPKDLPVGEALAQRNRQARRANVARAIHGKLIAQGRIPFTEGTQIFQKFPF